MVARTSQALVGTAPPSGVGGRPHVGRAVAGLERRTEEPAAATHRALDSIAGA